MAAIVSPVAPAQRRPESEPRRHQSAASPKSAMGVVAQRRPESEPRRHMSDLFQGAVPFDAQRRPESEPRRHIRRPTAPADNCERSTKAGVGTPATPIERRRREAARADRSTKAGVGTPATPLGLGRNSLPLLRSTKAGVGTPATLENRLTPSLPAPIAQRRPESEPRRHHGLRVCPRTPPGRSTKAGVGTPATR